MSRAAESRVCNGSPSGGSGSLPLSLAKKNCDTNDASLFVCVCQCVQRSSSLLQQPDLGEPPRGLEQPADAAAHQDFAAAGRQGTKTRTVKLDKLH